MLGWCWIVLGGRSVVQSKSWAKLFIPFHFFFYSNIFLWRFSSFGIDIDKWQDLLTNRWDSVLNIINKTFSHDPCTCCIAVLDFGRIHLFPYEYSRLQWARWTMVTLLTGCLNVADASATRASVPPKQHEPGNPPPNTVIRQLRERNFATITK
jgi:hypothetical protein